MGLYDTMQQVATPQTGAVNGTSAQKQPLQNAWQQKQQQRANPVMQGRPAMQNNMQKPNNNMAFGQAAGNLMNAYQNRPTPTSGQIPGGMGSITENQNKMQALKNAQSATPGGNGSIGGTYGQLVGARPELQSYRDTGQAAGQDMSWMDKPGALQMAAQQAANPQPEPQSGIANLQTPRDQQLAQEQLQSQQQAAAQPENPVMQEPEQDMGSQDPRELLRMKMAQGVGNPDVMARSGIGPSNPMQAMGQPMQQVQMDENGLEPRRGAR